MAKRVIYRRKRPAGLYSINLTSATSDSIGKTVSGSSAIGKFSDGVQDQPFTYTLWQKNMVPSNNVGIVARWNLTSTRQYWIVTAVNELQIGVWDNSESDSVTVRTTDGLVNDGSWNHIAIGHSGNGVALSDFKFYANGVEMTNKTYLATPSTYVAKDGIFTKFVINVSSNGGVYYDQKITQYCIWDKLLSGAEITELYNNGNLIDATQHSASANLVQYWAFTDLDITNSAAIATIGSNIDWNGGTNASSYTTDLP